MSLSHKRGYSSWKLPATIGWVSACSHIKTYTNIYRQHTHRLAHMSTHPWVSTHKHTYIHIYKHTGAHIFRHIDTKNIQSDTDTSLHTRKPTHIHISIQTLTHREIKILSHCSYTFWEAESSTFSDIKIVNDPKFKVNITRKIVSVFLRWENFS